MGVTADTPTNLVVGAGNVLVDHANIGSSTESNLFAIDREIFTPDLNGVKGALVGTDYITSSIGRLETTIPEINGLIMSRGWPGSSSTGAGAMEVIDEDEVRRIPLTDYHDWEVQVERLGGGQFQFEVDNALQVGGLEYELQDDGLVAPRFSVTGRWDAAALTTSPHRIRILAVAS
jgi:hypothetical protein